VWGVLGVFFWSVWEALVFELCQHVFSSLHIVVRTGVEVDIGPLTMLLFVTSQIVDLYSEC